MKKPKAEKNMQVLLKRMKKMFPVHTERYQKYEFKFTERNNAFKKH